MAKERDDKDYAIEFGEYLACAAEAYLSGYIAGVTDREADLARSLRSAIYEFRKRAGRALKTRDRR
jgi:hypothetical protein